MKKIFTLFTLLISTQILAIDKFNQEKLNTELFNQIHIDYLIDMGIDFELVKNLDRSQRLTESTFKALYEETFMVKSDPSFANAEDKSVEMNGEFVVDGNIYSYHYNSLAGLATYQNEDGTIVGEVDDENFAWWWGPVIIAECAGVNALCNRSCVNSCAYGVANSSCWSCGIYTSCSCNPPPPNESDDI